MHSKVLSYFKKNAIRRSVRAGEIILHQGEASDAAYYLDSGLALTYTVLPNGKQKHLGFVQTGELINISALLLGQPSRFYALAAAPCTVLVLPSSALQTCLEQVPQAKDDVLAQLAHSLDAMHDKIMDDTLYDSDMRVARFICRAVEQHFLSEQDTLPTIPFSQTVIADVVGISRSRVNRSLQIFAEKGWLSVGYGRIVVLSVAQLRQFAFQE